MSYSATDVSITTLMTEIIRWETDFIWIDMVLTMWHKVNLMLEI